MKLVEEAGVHGSEDEVEDARFVVDVAQWRGVHRETVEWNDSVWRVEHLYIQSAQSIHQFYSLQSKVKRNRTGRNDCGTSLKRIVKLQSFQTFRQSFLFVNKVHCKSRLHRFG